MTTISKLTFSDKSHEFSAHVSGVDVSIYRDSIGVQVRAAVYVTVRGVLVYRIAAHSRKNSLRSVFMWVRDFEKAVNSGDESAFYDLLADAKLDYMSTQSVLGSIELVVFNLDCEAE